MKKLMNALKHELSLFAVASVFAFVCALAWGSPFVGNSFSFGSIFAKSSAPLRSEIFRGTVVRSGAQLLLRDRSGQVYRFDNAAQAEPYVGKIVTVTGRIDATARLIRVQNIEEHGA